MSQDLESNTDQKDYKIWDALLAKYVRVWVWSILFGATSGLSFSYLGIRGDYPVLYSLAAFPLILFLLGVFATFGAWVNLLWLLQVSIIPVLFEFTDHDILENSNTRIEYQKKRSVRAITQAYKYLALAGMVRLLISASEFLFQILSRRGF